MKFRIVYINYEFIYILLQRFNFKNKIFCYISPISLIQYTINSIIINNLAKSNPHFLPPILFTN